MSTPKPDETHSRLPGSIRAAIPHPAGGTIVLAGFPGLETAVDGTAVFVPDACDDTLEGMAALGAEKLHVLIEADELDGLFLRSLKEAAEARGLEIVHVPIVDYAVPTADQSRQWAEASDARLAAFARGETLAFACQYGAGRSGMMAARCLIEGGIAPVDAIALVRRHFAEAIESDAQEAWLMASA